MAFHRAEVEEIRKIAQRIGKRAAFLFKPPAKHGASDAVQLKDRGIVCRHGRFRFERCSRCNRTIAEAQAELRKIQRMYE